MKIKIIHYNVRYWINSQNINTMSNYLFKEDPDVINFMLIPSLKQIRT